jgi:predicted Zn-ribbon and HTH transcriptional regulator
MSAFLFHRCPRCNSYDIARSHRRNRLERLASLVVVPWRCRECYLRFFSARWFRPTPTELRPHTFQGETREPNPHLE